MEKNVKPNLFPLLVLVHIGIHHLLYHFETHEEQRKKAFFAVFRPKSHHFVEKNADLKSNYAMSNAESFKLKKVRTF